MCNAECVTIVGAVVVTRVQRKSWCLFVSETVAVATGRRTRRDSDGCSRPNSGGNEKKKRAKLVLKLALNTFTLRWTKRENDRMKTAYVCRTPLPHHRTQINNPRCRFYWIHMYVCVYIYIYVYIPVVYYILINMRT